MNILKNNRTKIKAKRKAAKPKTQKTEYRTYRQQIAFQRRRLNEELDSHGELMISDDQGYVELGDAGSVCVRDWKHRRLVDMMDIQKSNTIYVDKDVKVIPIMEQPGTGRRGVNTNR